MRIFRFIITLVLVLLVVVLAALSYLHFADLNRHRATIEAMVADATGRAFTMGNLELDLLPAIRLQVDDLALANADWGSEPMMAEAGHLVAAVRPFSLLIGPVEVVDVEVSDVDVLVETDAEGNSNWSFPAEPGEEAEAEGEDEPGEGGLAIILDDVSIDNVVVTQRSPGADDQVYRLDEFTVRPDGEDQMVLAGSGELLTLPVKLTGEVGTRHGLADAGAGDYTIALALGGLAVDLSGNQAAAGSGDASHMKAVVSSEDLAALLQSLRIEFPAAGALSLTADISTVEGGVKADISGGLGEVSMQAAVTLQGGSTSFEGQVSPLDRLGEMLEVADLPASDLRFNGTLSAADGSLQLSDVSLSTGDATVTVNGKLAPEGSESTLQVKGGGESLADLMTTLPALPFDLSAALTLTAEQITVDPLEAHVGGSDLSGSARVTTGERGALEVELASQRLDLVEFSGDEKAGEGEESPPAVESANDYAEAPAASDGKYVFKEEPLPFEMLQQREMDVTLAVAELVTGAGTLEDLEAAGTLHEGALDATADFNLVQGGRSTNHIQLKTAGEQADLLVDIKVRELRANIASGEVEDPKDIPPINITVDLKSAGGTPRALAANSNGSMLLTVEPGVVEAGMLGAVSGDVIAQLFSALNPLAETDPKNELECAVLVIDIEDGVAKIEPLLMKSDKLMITAGGTVDLNTEKLNIEFNTKPRKGIGISADMFVTPFVSLEGTLASPGIGMNEKGTLLTAGAAVATGGLSFLYQGIADRATAEIDHCMQTVPKFPHPSLEGD